MSRQSYLLDTNIIIGLEDNHTVQPAYSQFSKLAATHKVDVFVHEAARDDILQDKDVERRKISLSKIEKFQSLEKVRGLTDEDLESLFGRIRKHNDRIDATLLHALYVGAVDFLVTQDNGLHDRARRFSPDLARRVLFVGDATQLLVTTFEPKKVPIRYVDEVSAHTISVADPFFDSLREGYPEFDEWWTKKCVAKRRSCWVVYDDQELAGIIVRKDESAIDTDATLPASKILKICTFKVSPSKRGVKLGELLLKQALWYAHKNNYDLIYLTAYQEQTALLNLLEYYGFTATDTKGDGELIYEKPILSKPPDRSLDKSLLEINRTSYPRFVVDDEVPTFGIPIKESYHDTLFPDLQNHVQHDLFDGLGTGARPSKPGNTIRKVYLCRAQSKLGEPGSILLFYKSKSDSPPSQAITSVGILESVSIAHSTRDLMQLTGGRSVYSESQLAAWAASPDKPVKVINYLLAGYIDPPVKLNELRASGIVKKNPPQSIYGISTIKAKDIIKRAGFG